MEKIVCVVMGQDCEKTIKMCLESVEDADKIIYVDGGSKDNTLNFILEKVIILKNEYNKKDYQANGKQRNFYLKYLNENYKDWWCLVLDADEVLEDFGIVKIKHIITQLKEPMLLSPRIHHFIGNLGYEDNTKEIHFVPNRFFQVNENITYQEIEHPVLMGKKGIFFKSGSIDVHLWHLRETLGIFETLKKFKSNTKKSNIHTKNQLEQWNRDMLFGNYPKKRVHYDSIPEPIKREFKI